MNKTCPICKRKSAMVKIPMGRILLEKWGCLLHIANEIKFKCMNCNYETEVIRNNTQLGDYYSLPFWKRLFTKYPTK